MVSLLSMESWRDTPHWPWMSLAAFRGDVEAICRHVYEQGERVYIEIDQRGRRRDGVVVGPYRDTEVTIVLDEFAVLGTGMPTERPVE